MEIPKDTPTQIKKLIAKARRASSKCVWGSYPMAPSIGLNDEEIEMHREPAGIYYQVSEYFRMVGNTKLWFHFNKCHDQHCLVVNRNGNYYRG